MNKIAIIDDNLVFREVTKRLIKNIGYLENDIITFKNGKEIYDFIKNNIVNIEILPKILLLDLNMPIMDGWDFLNFFQLFKTDYNYEPMIYIVTSSVDEKDYDKAMNISDVKGYLIKPINATALTKII